MGGWGQDNCNGDNPACYRDANFDNAFPTGVTIGCATGYTLTFTSSEAVAIFLPCGGPPSVLSASATDPGCVSNVLAGQLLTAKLSLGFDAADPDFGSAPVPATTLVMDQGAYEGYTIAEVVDLADRDALHEAFAGTGRLEVICDYTRRSHVFTPDELELELN